MVNQFKNANGEMPMTFPEVMIREGERLVKTQMHYQTAISVQKPRILNQIREKLMEEADSAGEAFYYNWIVTTKKGKKVVVEGPSIQLAVSAARLWGNCGWGCTYTEDEDHYFLDGQFVDLETGFNVSRPFRQRKVMEMGKYDEDRKEDIAFQIGISKCMRNVIVSGGIPRWLINQAVEAAKVANVKRFEKLWKEPAKRKETIENAVTAFEKIGINQGRLEKMMGPIKSWTPQTMAELAGMLQAIRDGQSTVEEIFAGETRDVDEEVEKTFAERIQSELINWEKMEEYLNEYSRIMKTPKIQIKTQALMDWDSFNESFQKWLGGKQNTARGRKKRKTTGGGKPKEEKSPPEANTEAGAGEQNQAPLSKQYKFLWDLIPKRVVDVLPEQVDKIMPKILSSDQANEILHFLVKELPKSGRECIEQEEFIKKLNEICKE